MSKSNLFIPRRINVGFQDRSGTYTGKLAYIIYFDEKGKLRKETSWENWRDKSISNIEYDNEPTEGFVLNKKVGGYCNHWSDFRQAYVRVYDPRGFEFEITVPNLLYILENTSCIKGKGLDGEFVYGWDGTDLVLVPTGSPDYEQLEILNNKRFANKKILAKDLKIGATYLARSGAKVVYLGKFDYYDKLYFFDGKFFETYGKMNSYANKNGKELGSHTGDRNIFGHNTRRNNYDTKVGTCAKRHFFSTYDNATITTSKSVPSLLIDVVSEDCISDYAQRFEKLETSTMYSPYDEQKDVKVYYDYETFEQRINGCKWDIVAHAEWNGEDVCVKVRHAESGKVICEKANWNNTFDPRDIFPCDNSYTYKKMFPVEPKEVYDKLKFFYTEQYLANGKYYRREW